MLESVPLNTIFLSRQRYARKRFRLLSIAKHLSLMTENSSQRPKIESVLRSPTPRLGLHQNVVKGWSGWILEMRAEEFGIFQRMCQKDRFSRRLDRRFVKYSRGREPSRRSVNGLPRRNAFSTCRSAGRELEVRMREAARTRSLDEAEANYENC
jgi:hypothetical protein